MEEVKAATGLIEKWQLRLPSEVEKREAEKP
jgi:hypothetical protein